MSETVYSAETVDGLMMQLVEAQSMVFGMMVGTNIHAGLWSEAEARFRLEGLLATAEGRITKAIITGVLDQFIERTGPFLQVIDGGLGSS